MLPPEIQRFFLPLGNPLGFNVYDAIGVFAAAILIAAFLWHRQIVAATEALAAKPIHATILIAALPVVLRLALLPHHPIPTPRVADDFSYLLLGDTLAHLRLANPIHPMHRFFEGVFILQQPTYASNFPIGQGIALAVGQWLGNPWFGVLISVAAFAAACHWMLRAWLPPVWALTGALLAAIEFGPLSGWMNTYWGGAVSALAGCLIFGALARPHSRRNAILLGAGLGLQMLSRPFEFVLVLIALALFRIPPRSLPIKFIAIATLAFAPAALLTLAHNKSVTGQWTQLPYVLSRYQYGIPTTFRFQPVPIPHNDLTVEQRLDYETQTETHDRKPQPGERLPFLRFFLLAPLYLALPFGLRYLTNSWFLRALATLTILWLGAELYPYFYAHYIAAGTCLFLFIAIRSLESLSRISPRAATAVLALCVAHFAAWYVIHATGGNLELAAMRYELWDEINTGDPESRISINRTLNTAPGRHLVFVRYLPQHGPQDWIHNAADIDNSRIVWAVDRGPAEDLELQHYFPDRTYWTLDADLRPPKLSPMQVRP